MKHLFVLFTSLLISTSMFAQKAAEIENWLNSVEKEFVEINRASATSNIGSGSPIYNRVRFNLLSDDYFVPVFGKPFNELSKLKRSFVAKKLTKLKRQKKIGTHSIKYPWANRLDWYMWGVFSQPAAYNAAIKEVVSIKTIRQQYTTTIKKIEGNQVNFDYLSSEKTMIESKYSKLLPSEINTLKKLIEIKEGEVANKDLLVSANKLKSLDKSFASLTKLNSFLKNNKIIYRIANQETRDRANSLNEIKINEILDYLVTVETKNLSTKSISELNNFHRTFTQKYNDFNSFKYKQVKGVESEILTVKTNKIIAQLNVIESKIELIENNKELSKLEQFYLSLIYNSKDSKIVNLKKKIRNREITITNEKEQLRKEKERQHLLAETEAMEKFGFKFNTQGLKNGELIKHFFKGDFIKIPFNRDDMLFGGMIRSYMYSYAKNCDVNLPKNKVEIYEDVCKTETVTKDGYGMEVSRYCSQYVKRGTNLFASPELYKAYTFNQSIMSADGLKVIGKMITQMGKADGIQNMTNVTLDIVTLQTDMANLIALNGCDNKALKRFEQNLIKFAYNSQPIRLDQTIAVKKVDYNRPHNYGNLVNDLILKNAESWAMNKYIANSIDNLHAVSSGGNKQPTEITANYSFNGFFGRKINKVKVVFIDGIPDCLYFQDNPSMCRTADREIVSDFINGQYIIE